MAGSQMLFACTKCHSRHPFEELSKEEQLCKSCRRKYPLVACQYCQVEYHIIKRVDGSPVCAKCAQNISSYGLPKACKYCQIHAAFKTSYCARCTSSRKRYGEPVSCQLCKKKCAFNKSSESRAKVAGQILCVKCTLGYKKEKHQQLKLQKRDGNFDEEPPVHFSRTKGTPGKVSGDYQSRTGSSDKPKVVSSEKVIAPLKAENLAKTFKSRIESVDGRPDSRLNSPFINNSLSAPKQKRSPSESSNHDSKLEPSFGDHLSEMNKLRDEIAMLKKVISQKDKIILEKDKKINEFNAEKWDLEKLHRQKLSVIEKDFDANLTKLRHENGDLRKQVMALKKKKAKIEAQQNKKIRLEVFKPHSPSMTPGKASLDSPSESKDSDSDTKSNLKQPKEDTTENKEEVVKVEGVKDTGDNDEENNGSTDKETEKSGKGEEKQTIQKEGDTDNKHEGIADSVIKEESSAVPEKIDGGEELTKTEKLEDNEDKESVERKKDLGKKERNEDATPKETDRSELLIQDADDENTSGEVEESAEVNIKKKRKRKLSHDVEDTTSGADEDDMKAKKKKKKKTKMFIDDDDDDDDVAKETEKQLKSEVSEVNREKSGSDEEIERPHRKKSVVLSDDDLLQEESGKTTKDVDDDAGPEADNGNKDDIIVSMDVDTEIENKVGENDTMLDEEVKTHQEEGDTEKDQENASGKDSEVKEEEEKGVDKDLETGADESDLDNDDLLQAESEKMTENVDDDAGPEADNGNKDGIIMSMDVDAEIENKVGENDATLDEEMKTYQEGDTEKELENDSEKDSEAKEEEEKEFDKDLEADADESDLEKEDAKTSEKDFETVKENVADECDTEEGKQSDIGDLGDDLMFPLADPEDNNELTFPMDDEEEKDDNDNADKVTESSTQQDAETNEITDDVSEALSSSSDELQVDED